MIFHLSYPRSGDSLNSETPRELCRVKYSEFDDAIKRCLEEGVGCHISRSDISSAFRNLGIRPEHWFLLLMKARNPKDNEWYYFVDKCLPFGSSISCAHFQAVSDGIANIVKYHTGKKVTNYLDDFLFAALLRLLRDDQVRAFLWVCHEISLPVNEKKTFWGTTYLTFLGLLIDTVRQIICIPVEKVKRAKDLFLALIGNRKIKIHQLQRLCGFLNFLCRAIVPGRAFTRSLYAPTAGKVLKPHHHVAMNNEMRADLQMWLIFLNKPDIYCRPFMESGFSDPEEVRFYTDASRNFSLGFGGWCETDWMFGQWDDYTKEIEPSIEYLELYGLAVGIHLWIERFKNKRIYVFCDNMSVVHMVNNMSSSCKNCMVLIRMVTLECMCKNVRLFAKHIGTLDNGIADGLSRLDFKQFQCLTDGMNMSPLPTCLPDKLWPIKKIWLH